MRFLIDECLSPALVRVAHDVGHEAYHVAHLGLGSAEDWTVGSYAVSEDQILVTNNRSDFRALYSRLPLHPGLLIVVPSVERGMQIRLFEALLAKLAEIGEPMNRILEARLDGGDIGIELYAWPQE